MNEVNNISLEDLAAAYQSSMPDHLENEEIYGYELGYKDGAKAGAQWQKEQDKAILQLAHQIIVAYNLRHPTEPQLLVGYTNKSAIEKINNYVFP